MKLILVGLLCLAFLFNASPVYAVGGCLTSDPPQLTDLVCVFVRIIQAVIALGGAGALIFIILGGIKYAASGGDPKAVADAQRTLTFAILGFLLAVGAVTIIQFIGRLIGVRGTFRWVII